MKKTCSLGLLLIDSGNIVRYYGGVHLRKFLSTLVRPERTRKVPTLKEAYYEFVRPVRTVAKETLRMERLAIEKFERLVPIVSTSDVTEVDSVTLARFKASWIQLSMGKPTTFNKHLSKIKSIMASLVEIGVIPYVPRCKRLPERDAPIRTLSADVVDGIYRACSAATWPVKYRVPPELYWRAIVILGVNTGLRRGDLLALEWEDIDFEKKTLRYTAGKTGKTRVLPISDSCVRHLRQMQTTGRKKVFYTTRCNRQFYREWHRIQRKAGVTDHFKIHDLRRTCGSRVYRAAGVNAASEFLAHSSIAVTKRHYVAEDFVAERLREAQEIAAYSEPDIL